MQVHLPFYSIKSKKKLNVSLLIKQTSKETIFNPLTSMSDQDQDRNSPYNTATISSKGIQYQILRTNITRIVWQTVRRITTIMRLGSDRFRETRALDVKLNCIEIQSLFKEIKCYIRYHFLLLLLWPLNYLKLFCSMNWNMF